MIKLLENMATTCVQVCFADSREPAEGIYIIAKGWVDLCLPVKQGGSALRVLKRGFVNTGTMLQ